MEYEILIMYDLCMFFLYETWNMVFNFSVNKSLSASSWVEGFLQISSRIPQCSQPLMNSLHHQGKPWVARSSTSPHIHHGWLSLVEGIMFWCHLLLHCYQMCLYSVRSCDPKSKPSLRTFVLRYERSLIVHEVAAFSLSLTASLVSILL